MLKPKAFANSLAALCGLMYVAFLILASVSKPAFDMLFNAQFMGADLAPESVVFNLGALVAMVVLGWVLGYVWAWLYNRFAR